MSSNSEAVKKWRKATKNRIIESMGGKCTQCGYNDCPEAMDLHHLDPKEKELSFGKIRANPKSWDKIVLELKKCVLLCANCHREYHAGFIDLKTTITTFNDSYIEYKEVREKDKCPVCNKPKVTINKTCSRSCAAKLVGKIDWESIDLETLLWEQDFNFSAVGRLLDCSGAAVSKRAIKLGLW